MPEIEDKIREIARNLLKQKEVDLVIGFADGSMPLHATPCFVREEKDVDRLVWNSFCENNLAQYLPNRSEKVAIVVKGCDSRALIELIKEHQIPRQQMVVIGVPCRGMVDRKRVESSVGEREILEVEDVDGKLILKGDGFTETLDRDDYLYPSCGICDHRNPVVYDVLVGDTIPEREADSYSDVEEFEAKTDQERWEHVTAEFDKCIRCYACRNACPLCYCKECFVDKSRPQWIGKTTNPSDTAIFHIMRAFHLAGRCVECGACERACPMSVDIRGLNRKLAGDVKRLFNYQAGTSLEEVAPLSTFRPDDPEEFMLDL